jgi:hypothetical protein
MRRLVCAPAGSPRLLYRNLTVIGRTQATTLREHRPPVRIDSDGVGSSGEGLMDTFRTIPQCSPAQSGPNRGIGNRANVCQLLIERRESGTMIRSFGSIGVAVVVALVVHRPGQVAASVIDLEDITPPWPARSPTSTRAGPVPGVIRSQWVSRSWSRHLPIQADLRFLGIASVRASVMRWTLVFGRWVPDGSFSQLLDARR